ncbi:hypothetical protein A1O1_05062 [Capronia coronata CBS 617.96]|uniref:Restriction of telomere capping protein 4 n=1 Tax=Capronia coronata CBS 617.96 TaxID=1182541 RepID=W9Z0T1_9EURO|nr:uncharacterized protein A1O1_05062 [Capronia coronata CBS 617.96]EXJ88134.1 hypothetical protein A1O1_05062 [Capronia coronata CBS 617.96]
MELLDASYSRTYLTRLNYRGPPLLRKIGGTKTGRHLAAPAGADSGDSIMAPRKRQEEEEDLAIYAQPLSSDDEDYNNSTKSQTNLPKKPQDGQKASCPAPKPPSTTTAARRSKRRKITDEPSLDTLPVVAPEYPAMPDPFPEWNSSGSQKRKVQRSYANRRFQRPEPVESKPTLPESEKAFASYDEVPKRGNASEYKVDFVAVAALPGKRMIKSPTTLETKLDIVDVPKKGSVKEHGFQLPDLPDIASSATTSGGGEPIFDTESANDKPNKRRRSGSTSSLSSVDSMFILEHQGELLEKDEILQAEPSTLRCPVCQEIIKDSVLLLVPNNLRTLSFQRQQNFCVQHQVAEAKEKWQRRGYPEINWDDFEKTRLPAKLPFLEQVIMRKTPSYYLEQLDEKIRAAKGNRKAVKLYLNQGIVDIAKQGYYGPRGARVMVGAITTELTKTLNGALRSDSTLRAAGVGGYVSAVLVPELTARLVMEDMGLPSSEEARDVLDESSRIGALLNPDDDHIEREDDEYVAES